MDTAVRPDQDELRIRALTRDGWTYAGIAAGMLLLGAACAIMRTRIPDYYNELATLGGVSVASGSVCGVLGAFRLWQAGVIQAIPGWILRLLWRVRLYILLGIVSAATFFLFHDPTIRAAAIAFTPALVFGGSVLAVAQWWRGARMNPRKHAMFRLILAAPVFYLLACGAEFYVALRGKSLSGTSHYLEYDVEEVGASMRFCRTLPTGVRRLVWDQLNPQTDKYALMYFGFPPEDVLEQACSASNYGRYAMLGWYVAAPEAAMAFALAAADKPVNRSADEHAGALVGCAGSVEQVRAKLSGQYSQDYVDGLCSGIWSSNRIQRFAPEFRGLITRGYNSRTLWYMLMRADWEFAFQQIRAMAASADQQSLSKLRFAVRTITDVELALEIAESPHAGVRVLMLPMQFNFEPRWMGALIRIAEGKVPNPDPLERRTVALTLMRFTRKTTASFQYNTKPGIAPLSAQEEADIQEIVTEAHKRIGTKP